MPSVGVVVGNKGRRSMDAYLLAIQSMGLIFHAHGIEE